MLDRKQKGRETRKQQEFRSGGKHAIDGVQFTVHRAEMRMPWNVHTSATAYMCRRLENNFGALKRIATGPE
ncbi:hypothetical protein JCM19000A_41550 [Silvimonas sp. JCM 19000]